MAEKKMPGAIIYLEIRDAMEQMDMEDRGRLFTALLDYANDGSLPKGLKALPAALFALLRPKLDRDREKYENLCRQRRYAVYCREERVHNRCPLSFAEWHRLELAHHPELQAQEDEDETAPAPSGGGPSSTGIGPSSSGIGPSSTGIGSSSTGIGSLSSGIGSSSVGIGSSSVDIGSYQTKPEPKTLTEPKPITKTKPFSETKPRTKPETGPGTAAAEARRFAASSPEFSFPERKKQLLYPVGAYRVPAGVAVPVADNSLPWPDFPHK